MKEIIISKPRKPNIADLGALRKGLIKNLDLLDANFQAFFEKEVRNIIMLRVLRMSEGSRQSHMPKRLPFRIDYALDKVSGKSWVVSWKRRDVDIKEAYRLVKKDLNSAGILSRFFIDRENKKHPRAIFEVYAVKK